MNTEAENIGAEPAESEDVTQINAQEGAATSEATEGGQESAAGGGGDAPRTMTQAEVDSFVQRRLGRQQRKHGAETDALQAELEKVRNENNLYRVALEQRGHAGPPDPDQFADGEYDPAYQRAAAQHQERQLGSLVDQRVEATLAAQAQRQQQDAEARRLEEGQRAHYRKAATLGVDDYEQAEDAVIAAIGDAAVTEIAARDPDNAHTLFYTLGKSPEKLREFASKFKADPVAGLLYAGALSRDAVVRPSTPPVPEPEEALEGGGNSAAEMWIKRLNEKRDQVAEGKATMDEIADIKRDAMAAGVSRAMLEPSQRLR